MARARMAQATAMSYTFSSVCSSIVVIVLMAGCTAKPKTEPLAPKIACDPDNAGITVPAGFCALTFAEGLAHARYIDVSGARHMVAGDRNDQFAKAIEGFLKDLRKRK